MVQIQVPQCPNGVVHISLNGGKSGRIGQEAVENKGLGQVPQFQYL